MAIDAGAGLGYNLKIRQEMLEEVVQVRTSSFNGKTFPTDPSLDP